MENIALAFSGGGFRAALFSLGSLSYLDKIQYKGQPLLKNVKFISSTSGGSITNLAYSSFLFKGKSLQQCSLFLLNELDGEKLIDRALSILNSSEEWNKRPAKGRNTINAFSIAYDELFTKEVFEIFSNRQNNPHLEEICVNSTEFTNGLPFRFQSQHPDANFPKGNIGNAYIFFDKNGISAAGKLKLSDILASSSCFPSGFEPMIFPNDYSYDQLTNKQLRDAISFKANNFTIEQKKTEQKINLENEKADTPVVKTPDGLVDITQQTNAEYEKLDLLADKEFEKDLHFGLMDGGVADNQAIDAFKRADKRRFDHGLPGFDLFIACDVTSFYMDGYTLPMEKKKWYNKISLAAIIIFWIAVVLILPALLFFVKGQWQAWIYIIATISGLAALPVLYFLYSGLKKIVSGEKRKSTWNSIFKKHRAVFLKLRIGALKQMLAARLKSVFILANDIYLKQIRRMYYDNLFSDTKYKDRVIQNAIYDLSRAKFPNKNIPADQLQPSAAMIEVAEKARTMGTTLWFDEKHQADKIKECILATGKFTTCYNLLKHLNKKDETLLSPELKQLKKDLYADWEKFCVQPM